MFTWEKLATAVEKNGYDTEVNWDEEYFICPYCEEPVLECDFPRNKEFACPICGEPFLRA